MITFTVLYPNEEGKRFDANYYLNNHLPMVQQKLGAACRNISVEKGICGASPEASAPYLFMVHLAFESVTAFQTAFGPIAEEILADIPNYTDLQPVIQISEVIR